MVSCAAKYHRPARFDDRLELRTVVLEAEPSHVSFGAWLFGLDDGGEAAGPLAKLWSLHAYASGELQAQPVPDWLLERVGRAVWTGPFFSSRRRSPPGF